ncbi:MAG: (2Fe-2S) ferredoxin domain-containing protein [Armatimonadetes bacterium]|nr:(2Fe-2S) ferredoxin domain-containing protein [Armatimonadota bacterium]
MKTREELRAIRERAKAALAVRDSEGGLRVVVAMGTCGIAAGAREIMGALLDELSSRGLSDVSVTQTGCRGLCDREPMVEVLIPGRPGVSYCRLTPQAMRRIVADHLVNGQVVNEYAIGAGTEA